MGKLRTHQLSVIQPLDYTPSQLLISTCNQCVVKTPPSEIPQRHASGPPPFCAQGRRDVRVRVVGRDRDLVPRGQRGTLVDFDVPRRALPLFARALGWRGYRRGGVEIELDVPDRILTRSSAPGPTSAAARERGHSGCRSRGGRRGSRGCRDCGAIAGGGERVASRARTEGPLERVLEPGDLFRAEAGEPRQLRRIGLCDLREAL